MRNKFKIVNWLARILGGLAILFFGVFVIGEGLPDMKEGVPSEIQSTIILFGFFALGYIFAWFREKEGGIVMILAGAIQALSLSYLIGPDDWPVILIFSLPFLLPGLLFWWAGREN